MTVNLHTHTPRCRHAAGTEEEYIRAALDSGLKTLGFSDHTPYWFPGEYYSHMRMFPEQLQDYIHTVLALKEKYRSALDIRLGLEVEYYPDLFPELMRHLQDTPIEYMLLGQHWVGNEMDEPYCGAPTEDETVLRRYCDQVIDALETGLFTYVAHPDLIHYVGDSKTYAHHIRRLCRAAKSCDIPLEINLLGLRAQRHYPHLPLWRIAAEEGCKVVIGSDAHEPGHVLQPENEAQAMEIVNTLGLELITEPTIRRIS